MVSTQLDKYRVIQNWHFTQIVFPLQLKRKTNGMKTAFFAQSHLFCLHHWSHGIYVTNFPIHITSAPAAWLFSQCSHAPGQSSLLYCGPSLTQIRSAYVMSWSRCTINTISYVLYIQGSDNFQVIVRNFRNVFLTTPRLPRSIVLLEDRNVLSRRDTWLPEGLQRNTTILLKSALRRTRRSHIVQTKHISQ